MESRIEISRKHVADLTCRNNVLGFGVWQLNPVMKWVVSNPVYKFVDALSSFLKVYVARKFLSW